MRRVEEITEPSDTATNRDGDIREKVAACGEGPFLTDEAARDESGRILLAVIEKEIDDLCRK